MAGDDSSPKPRRKHTSSSHRTSKAQRSRKRHDQSEDEIATARPPPSLDELRKSRVEYFSKPPEERRRTMKYVYDQPLPSKSRTVKHESKDQRSNVSSSKSKAGVSAKESKKRSRDSAERADSDDGRVYSMRPESTSEAHTTRRSVVRPVESIADKATVQRPPSSKATVSRKPPQRRHTAPTTVVEVDKAPTE